MRKMSCGICSIFVVLFIFVQCKAYAGDVSHVMCKVNVNLVSADVNINGFPFLKVLASNENESTEGDISHLVFKGTNVVTVNFGLPDGSGQATNGPGNMGFSFSIKKSLLSTNRTVLSESTFVTAEGLALKTNFVFVVDEWSLERGDLLWTSALSSLSQDDQASIKAVVAGLKVALEQKDLPRLKVLYNYKNSLMAKSAGVSTGEMEAEQSAFFGIAFGGETYVVSCADLETLKYVVVSNANLVAISAVDGDVPLKVDLGDETSMKFPLLFSRTASNTWVIVE